MKNCTKHFNIRWAERIVELKDEKEIREYVTLNKEMINEHANKTFEFAQFLYSGQIGDNITRNYYIKDDIVFVTNTTDDAFITVYKVDMGFTSALNATVRKGLIKEIGRLSKEKEDIEFIILQEVEDKEFDIQNSDEQIKILEEQLNNLKKDRDFKKEEIKNIKSKSLNAGLDLRRYTIMLVNSKEYKSDLVSMK